MEARQATGKLESTAGRGGGSGFLDQGGQRSHPRRGEGWGEPRERRTVSCDDLQVAWSLCNSLRKCFPKGDPYPVETCGGCLLEVQLLKPRPPSPGTEAEGMRRVP